MWKLSWLDSTGKIQTATMADKTKIETLADSLENKGCIILGIASL